MRRLQPIFLCAVILLLTFLSSCSEDFNFGAGVGDWQFDGLPGNYEVWRGNRNTICLVKVKENGFLGTSIVDTYVSEIAYTSNYIFVQQVPPPEDTFLRIDTSNPLYFILSVSDGVLEGPYSETEFEEAYEALELETEPDWIKSTKLRDLID